MNSSGVINIHSIPSFPKTISSGLNLRVLATMKYDFLFGSITLGTVHENSTSSLSISIPNSSLTSRLKLSNGDSSPSLPPPGKSMHKGDLFVLLSRRYTSILSPIKTSPLAPLKSIF